MVWLAAYSFISHPAVLNESEGGADSFSLLANVNVFQDCS